MRSARTSIASISASLRVASSRQRAAGMVPGVKPVTSRLISAMVKPASRASAISESHSRTEGS